jgi:CHAT domain-containing protein
MLRRCVQTREVPGVATAEVRVVLVEYYLTGDEALLFLVEPDAQQPRLLTVPVDGDKLRKHVRALVDALGRMSRHKRDESPPPAVKVDTLLADPILTALVAPVLSWTASADVVYLVPHGVLHQVPLHAVPVDGVCLADEATVVYAPSASVLRYCRAHRGDGGRRTALLLADPPGPQPLVFGAAHEAALRRGRFTAEVLRGPDAARTALMDRFAAGSGAAAPAVLHVNAHGVAQADDAMRSGVELAGGRLTAADLLEMRLPGTLVTLAACRTAFSKNRPGDELLGLIRALMYAGAANVLVSLWDVDEMATAMLLDRFYRNLGKGQRAAHALAEAQRWLRDQTAADACAFVADMPDSDHGQAQITLAEARIRNVAKDFAGAAILADAAAGSAAADSDRRAARELRDGARIAARARRLPVFDRPVYRHPFFWAGFVLVGDWY